MADCESVLACFGDGIAAMRDPTERGLYLDGLITMSSSESASSISISRIGDVALATCPNERLGRREVDAAFSAARSISS